MKAETVRDWLGKYFLIATTAFGGYVFLLSETTLLPVSRDEAHCALQIILPLLVSQLTMVFQWFSGTQKESLQSELGISRWVVIGPPICVAVLLGGTIIMMILGNLGGGKSWAPSPATFRVVVTFCVTILTCTTVYVMSRYFSSVGKVAS